MLRRIKPAIFIIALAVAAVPAMVARGQQLEADPPKTAIAPPAPVPAPILTAEKVFISNAGLDVDIEPNHYSGGPTRAYDQFYAHMKSWGRYELVSTPADADLILELQLSSRQLVYGTPSSRSYPFPRFTLVIRDLRTRVVLWTLIEDLETDETRHLTHDESFDYALIALVNDVAKLAGLPPPLTFEKKKKQPDPHRVWHPERG